MQHEDVLKRLGERLDNLFQEKSKPDGNPFTNEDVAIATSINQSYLSKLRRGRAGNPSYMIMLRLSWFFDVPITYFSDGDVEKVNKIDVDDRFTELIAARAGKLSKKSRIVALELLERIYELEEENVKEE